MMHPHYSEFVDRVHQLPSETKHDRLIILRVLKIHLFFIEPEKRVMFVEEYYKWYKEVDENSWDGLLKRTNRDIYPNWHMVTAHESTLPRASY